MWGPGTRQKLDVAHILEEWATLPKFGTLYPIGRILESVPTQADIIVSSPDSTEVKLVVEAKLRLPSSIESESQLKRFMLQLGCQLGLLVSLDRMRVYRDRLTSYSDDSIELVGDFDTKEFFTLRGSETVDEIAFENAIQNWLEHLSSSGIGRVKNPKAREVVDHYILPAVESGIIRAAGPRSSR
jgi:hypothetical protein